MEALKTKYEAENKAFQAELDKRVHVYRVQFEAEFKALSEIWEKVSDLRSHMAGLRPGFDSDAPVGEDRVEKYRRRLPGFNQALANLKIAVFRYAPFYPEDIWGLLKELIVLAGQEQFIVSIACQKGDIPNDWFDKGEKSAEAMYKLADNISSAIRTRLHGLSFYPE